MVSDPCQKPKQPLLVPSELRPALVFVDVAHQPASSAPMRRLDLLFSATCAENIAGNLRMGQAQSPRFLRRLRLLISACLCRYLSSDQDACDQRDGPAIAGRQ